MFLMVRVSVSKMHEEEMVNIALLQVKVAKKLKRRLRQQNIFIEDGELLDIARTSTFQVLSGIVDEKLEKIKLSYRRKLLKLKQGVKT